MAANLVQFHVGRFDHPFFREQMRCAPHGYRYCTDEDEHDEDSKGPRRIALQDSRLRSLREHMERAAVWGLSRAGHVRRTSVAPLEGCSLIHSAQLLIRESRLPYVVDFENVEVFCLYQRVALSRPWAQRRLLHALRDDRCRFLLPWSQAARRGLASALGSEAARELEGKTLTVLPAIHPCAQRPAERDGGPLRILFVGTAFHAKGGVEAMRAVRRVRGSYDVALDLVSDVPERSREEIGADSGVTIHSWPVPRQRLQALFEEAHLLLFPSHMDTLGFVMLEAMAHGVPVLATRHFAAPELIEDDVSGILVDGENLLYGEDGLCSFDRTLPPPRSFRHAVASPSEPYVDRLAQALARLAADRDLNDRLAAGALRRVTDGPLSPARRQEALDRVYGEVLAA